jgi:hypothetical protein
MLNMKLLSNRIVTIVALYNSQSGTIGYMNVFDVMIFTNYRTCLGIRAN